MGMNRNLHIGWFCVLREDLDYYDVCEELAEKNPDWEDFITGTDPIIGEFDNICIFNGEENFGSFDSDEYQVLELEKMQINALSSEAQAFVAAVRERYGEDAIRVTSGIINWFN